ncbi:MAG: ADP-ribosylglycohydrolase family protein [Clostridia bacterium]|nr:ADP-ribosylglycohydrolase family protein [Clostridia bacterium]
MKLKIQPEKFHPWEVYSKELNTEYQQSFEEGLDIEKYKDVFMAAANMPSGEYKDRIADALGELVLDLPIREGYEYIEPSDLEGIKAQRDLSVYKNEANAKTELKKKIEGAWYGRICGCLLGKPVECAWTNVIHDILKSSGNFPLSRYIKSTDISDEIAKKDDCAWIRNRPCIDKISDSAPFDDDTNYTVMAQCMIDDYGDKFTPRDVLETWIRYQGRNAYCTAERVAYRNYLMQYMPPDTALFRNPYREWIGAQIRGDYYGYITSDPEKAAEMAWRDASISHIKNGIYGEMFISAMLACAHTVENIEDVIFGGLAQIPKKSRLYAQVTELICDYKNGATKDDAFNKIHSRYNNKNGHDWCHTISNALIVVASLLYGEGDYSKSICMAVETGFDTDCNGATVGSIIGMMYGIDAIDEKWTAPINGKLQTQILGHEKVSIDELVEKTLAHIEKFNA